MTFDPKLETDLVTREVRSGARDGEPTRILVASRIYPTDHQDVWGALTEQRRIAGWHEPVAGELREGGEFADGLGGECLVSECEAPTYFAVTRVLYGHVDRVRVTLTAVEGGTRVEFENERAFDVDKWGEHGPCVHGVAWDMTLMNLGFYLASGVPVDQDSYNGFSFSLEGKDFIRASAEHWGAAAYANGDDSQAAINSAERAYRFFTEPPADDFDDDVDS